jgi:hypothetical protein
MSEPMFIDVCLENGLADQRRWPHFRPPVGRPRFIARAILNRLRAALCYGVLLIAAAAVSAAAATPQDTAVELTLAAPSRTAECYELVLDQRFTGWDSLGNDLRKVQFELPGGGAVRSWFVEGNRASKYGRWYIEGADLDGRFPCRLTIHDHGEAVRAPNGRVAGTNFSTWKLGEFPDGADVAGFKVCLRNSGWAKVCLTDRLFEGGPVVGPMVPMGKDPLGAILSPRQYGAGEFGSVGLRDFHVLTQPGGRACLHEGYYYALLMGMSGKTSQERAIMWTRAKSLDGPWEKPIVLLHPQGDWSVVDQGTMVKLSNGKFVLMLRATVGNKNGLYVLTADSPTGFKLPEKPTAPVLDASSLDAIGQPNDCLALPHMIKLSEQSQVGRIPGTKGAWIAYCEVRQLCCGKSKWCVYGLYSTHPLGASGWSAMNGGRPVLEPSDDPQSAWFMGVANPKIIEVGPNRFVLGVNAYGQNLPEYRNTQDWRLWLGYSTDCTRFSQHDFFCAMAQFPGSEGQTGRIESAHWVLGPDEPLNGPMRLIYFAATMAAEPTTFGSAIYQAFGLKAGCAHQLELGARGPDDRSYIYRRLDGRRPAVIELRADYPDNRCQRGKVFLPAVLDAADPDMANGWAVVRNDRGQFRFCEIRKGSPVRYWSTQQETFLPTPEGSGSGQRREESPSRPMAWLESGRGQCGLLLSIFLLFGIVITFGRWLQPRGRLILGCVCVAAAVFCGFLIILARLAPTPSAASDPWYGVSEVQEADVKLSLGEESLGVQVSGPLGRVYLDVTAPIPKAAERHLFLGKADQSGYSVMPTLAYVLVHPPATPLQYDKRRPDKVD